MNLVDGDLELVFLGICPTSAPDEMVPTFRFGMAKTDVGEEVGNINFRAGMTENIRLFRGNIGFSVLDDFRGHRFSARSCLLLRPLIRFLGFGAVWITCNPSNFASKKNIERIGAIFIESAVIPEDSPFLPFYPPEARVKLRFEWKVDG